MFLFHKKVLDKWNNNKVLIETVLLATLFWGMATHGYMFFNNSFTHDSLAEFNSVFFGNKWKIELGRFLVPVYHKLIRGDIVVPWMIGMLSMLWIAIAVFLIAKLFRIKSRIAVFLVAGIFCSNLSVISLTATYIHDMDVDMFALLLSVFAAFVWQRYKSGGIIECILICMIMALYQSYISVTAILIMFVLINSLLDGAKFKVVFIKGLKSILMLAIGCVLYLIIVKIVSIITGIEINTENYNSLGNIANILNTGKLVYYLFKAYFVVITDVFFHTSGFFDVWLVGVINLLIFASTVALIIKTLRINKTGKKEVFLLLFLMFLMPFVMNITCVFCGGLSHDLISFAFWFIYLLIIIVCCRKVQLNTEKERKIYNSLCMVSCVGIVLLFISNVPLANQAYMKKNLEHNASLAFMSRVQEKIEITTGYEPQKTPVVIIGKPESISGKKMDGFERSSNLTGLTGGFALGGKITRSKYQVYFDYFLKSSVVMADEEKWDRCRRLGIVKTMPCYPHADSVKFIDDVLIVKLGDE